jgi:hypothetical protein
MIRVAVVTVMHEKVHHGASRHKQKGQCSQHMGSMFCDQEEADHDQES